ncbi:YHYH protein [Algicola sagamiensis]|uniref:YHYH protein n=1 Tax=Algicola sagamiensis TaxID=163869 RepID=UPI00035EEB17|nr:YHYH protein [Algicola sagamiensis]
MRHLMLSCYSLFFCVACNDHDIASPDSDKTLQTPLPFNVEQLGAGALIGDVTQVDCELENGVQTRCHKLTFKGNMVEKGPFCPEHLDEVGGLGVYDGPTNPGLKAMDRTLFTSMENDGFDIVDDSGNIRIADASRLNDYSEDFAYCLDAPENEEIELTYLLPTLPVNRFKAKPIKMIEYIGFTFHGIPIDGPAPSVIEGPPEREGGNIPALDPCGGHVAPAGYYHWHMIPQAINDLLDTHEVTSTTCVKIEQSATAMIGWAKDGYPIYSKQDVEGKKPENLDECFGHRSVTAEFPEGVYHYHALNPKAPNTPVCLKGYPAKNALSFNIHYDPMR